MNNVAESDLSINWLFSENLYSGRGGGLAIIFNVTSPINCRVCIFINNRAQALSGGLYSVVGEAHSNQTYLFKNNVFYNNSASLSGAFNFVILTVRQNGSGQIMITVLIHNCTFKQNTANIAGAIVIYFYIGCTYCVSRMWFYQ